MIHNIKLSHSQVKIGLVTNLQIKNTVLNRILASLDFTRDLRVLIEGGTTYFFIH